MANQPQHSIDEDDPDILALREVALSSLISKEKRKFENYLNNANHQNYVQNHPTQHQGPPQSNSEHLGHHINEKGHMNYDGQHAANFSFAPVNPNVYNNAYHPPIIARPSFRPRGFTPQPMPIVQPHLNPNFIVHHPIIPQPATFVPTTPDMHAIMPIDEDMPLLPDKMKSPFEPTPPSRLSPRSAEFVAANAEAMRRQRRRSFSPGRSRSRSPYKYHQKSRSRSRSPYYKAQVSHIARKRTKSKSKSPYSNKFIRKSRSPNSRLKIQEKRLSPKHSDERGNKREQNFKINGNGVSRDRHGNERRPLNSRPSRGSPKTFDNVNNNGRKEKKKGEDDKIINETSPKEKSQQHENKTSQRQEIRQKTEQEIEDELLASTDSEAESSKVEDDGLKMTLDEKDLDFLDDDEEESENEGRFKSKSSTSNQENKKMTGNTFKSSFPSKTYEKSKSFTSSDKNYSRYDNKQRKKFNDREDSKRDKRSAAINKSNDRRQKKSPENAATSTVESSQTSSKVVTINNKEKNDGAKKAKIIAQPMFKATFKSVDGNSDDKQKDGISITQPQAKDDRVRIVRSSVIERAETVKNQEKGKDIDANKRPAIMKRLGGYIKEPKASKAWAKEQAP
ncbi:CLUMA_CG004959, isoform A [Clunio marinus]|uniref:CLUMA_CG004959, isoform A n=1 Tax=Clunio marinus TaxID=568069 RepID=A0A1J1HT89_9DIPT|nr:CLUMA_CG004959, isoform A [Clunio marinus]